MEPPQARLIHKLLRALCTHGSVIVGVVSGGQQRRGDAAAVGPKPGSEMPAWSSARGLAASLPTGLAAQTVATASALAATKAKKSGIPRPIVGLRTHFNLRRLTFETYSSYSL